MTDPRSLWAVDAVTSDLSLGDRQNVPKTDWGKTLWGEEGARSEGGARGRTRRRRRPDRAARRARTQPTSTPAAGPAMRRKTPSDALPQPLAGRWSTVFYLKNILPLNCLC